MADRIKSRSMSHDEWKALGPLFREVEDNDYDGTVRERPQTPKWASLYVGGPNKVIGNPNHTSRNDAFTNAQSQWSHIMKSLDAADNDTVRLVRELAKEGNKISGISNNMHGTPDAWVAIASDEKTAGVLRGAIISTLEHFPADQGVIGQKLPTKIEDIPIEAMKKDMEAHRPKRLRKRTLDKGLLSFTEPDGKEREADREFASTVQGKIKAAPNSRPRMYAGAIGIFADNGMEQVATDYIKTIDSRLIPCLEKNGALWKEAGKDRKQGTFFAREYNPDSKQGKAADELLGRVDAAVFFVDGDPSSRVSAILAQASRLGKATKVVGPDGKEMPLFEASREAESVHMSKKEVAQSFNSHAFDMPASDPMAFLGLSMVKDARGKGIDIKDLSRIAEMTESVNDVADMADTPNGAKFLGSEVGLKDSSIRLLTDKDAMDSARRNTLRLRADLTKNDMQVIGPMDYSESLLLSGNAPPYLIVKGNADLVKNPGTIVGVTGAQAKEERDQRLTSGAIAKGVSALSMQDSTIAYVQGQTSVDIPEAGPQILISTTGESHLSKEDRAKQDRIVENGGVVIHTLPPENKSWYFDSTQINPKTGKKGVEAAVPAIGDANSERRSAELLGSISDSVLVGALNAKDLNSNQHATIMSGLEAGRPPVVTNFKEFNSVEHVSGNKALLSSNGAKGLERAGFHDRDIQSLFPSAQGKSTKISEGFSDRKVAIDTGINMDVAMPKLVKGLKDKTLYSPQQRKTRQPRVADQEL